MSAKTTELKPCPFCGSGNVRYKEAEHAVVCARCKARGSIAPDEEMAIRMWDERAGELKPDSWEKLEEENAGLRAKLEALIQSNDSYMKLPLDADGVPIRIGDEMVDICAEKPVVVDGYRRFPAWEKLGFTAKNKPGIYDPSAYWHKKPEPADSWEKLEEDVEQFEDGGTACEYFGSELTSCNGCKSPRPIGANCRNSVARDVLSRAKKLAGIEEEAQR